MLRAEVEDRQVTTIAGTGRETKSMLSVRIRRLPPAVQCGVLPRGLERPGGEALFAENPHDQARREFLVPAWERQHLP